MFQFRSINCKASGRFYKQNVLSVLSECSELHLVMSSTCLPLHSSLCHTETKLKSNLQTDLIRLLDTCMDRRHNFNYLNSDWNYGKHSDKNLPPHKHICLNLKKTVITTLYVGVPMATAAMSKFWNAQWISTLLINLLRLRDYKREEIKKKKCNFLSLRFKCFTLKSIFIDIVLVSFRDGGWKWSVLTVDPESERTNFITSIQMGFQLRRRFNRLPRRCVNNCLR